jgi:hypothetical protein
MSLILHTEGKPAICENIDEPGEYNACGNKPGTRRKILYYFTFM